MHFVQKWSTHGVQMLASHILFHNCFVVIAADEQKQAASGCSIDSFTALFKAFGSQYNLSFLIGIQLLINRMMINQQSR